MLNRRYGEMKNKLAGIIVVSLTVIGVDMVSKAFFRSREVAVLNVGGIFGLGEDWMWMTVVPLVLLVVGYFMMARSSLDVHWYGLAVIFASGVSNFIDRVVWGGVWDFIAYPFLNVVGNLADIGLGVGVVMIIAFDLMNGEKRA